MRGQLPLHVAVTKTRILVHAVETEPILVQHDTYDSLNKSFGCVVDTLIFGLSIILDYYNDSLKNWRNFSHRLYPKQVIACHLGQKM